MKAQKNTKIMVTCALLVALQVILARFLSINTTFVVVNFSFLAVALSGILFGPLWALAVGAVSDLIGATLFPFGAFFPGFTVTAGLVGLIYGLVLHQKGEGFHGRALWLRVVGASLCASLTRLVLNSVWLYIMYGKGLFGMLPARFTETICMVAAQILLIPVLLSLSRQLTRRALSPPEGLPPLSTAKRDRRGACGSAPVPLPGGITGPPLSGPPCRLPPQMLPPGRPPGQSRRSGPDTAATRPRWSPRDNARVSPLSLDALLGPV